MARLSLIVLFYGLIISVMAQETVKVSSLFNISIDPMERLLLVNFENDADTLYVGFEPQVFDDNINGKGSIIIGWRVDGRVDVYHEPGLRLDRGKYDIAGKGLANMIELEMSRSFFEIDDFGVQADYCFYDIHNREVIIRINEKNKKKRKPFGLLAPMGDAAENPSAMPMVLLHDFYFVRKKHANIELTINGRQHKTDNLPIPIDGTRMTFLRYSPKPLIATFNPSFTGVVPYFNVESNEEIVRNGNNTIQLEWIDNKPFISKIIFENKIHDIELRFLNSFPPIEYISVNSKFKGRFEIEADYSTGVISGDYTIEKIDNNIVIDLIPSGGWNPRPDKFSLRFLYTVAGVFKKWPTTYKWSAVLNVDTDGIFHMVSSWERINRK